MPRIDGKALAAHLRAQIKKTIREKNLAPCLEVLLVGEDPASILYVSLKEAAAKEVGIVTRVHRLPEDTPDDKLIEQIGSWNADPCVHAILVQLPLPTGHDEDRVMRAIAPKKDADGFHPKNIAALMQGNLLIVPPVHEGILRLIHETPLRLSGASGVLVTNSTIFSDPLKRLLTTAGMHVSSMRPDAIDRQTLQKADLIVIAIGRPKFLKPEMTKEDVVVIDVGTNKTVEGKTCGDADTEAFLRDRPDAWISPVPGGVGPMTVAQLMANAVQLTLVVSSANPQAQCRPHTQARTRD